MNRNTCSAVPPLFCSVSRRKDAQWFRCCSRYATRNTQHATLVSEGSRKFGRAIHGRYSDRRISLHLLSSEEPKCPYFTLSLGRSLECPWVLSCFLVLVLVLSSVGFCGSRLFVV